MTYLPMVERAPQVTASTSIVWVRLDLRLADNPALYAAQSFGPVVPVFIWSPEEEAPWQPGAASRWWLHQSLRAFQGQLERLDSLSIAFPRGVLHPEIVVGPRCALPVAYALESLETESKPHD